MLDDVMSKEQVAPRVRELRKSLGISQELLAERGGLNRVDISKLEGGHNFATTYPMRSALARGFGLTLDDIVELLDGNTPIATLKRRCRPAPQMKATGTTGR